MIHLLKEMCIQWSQRMTQTQTCASTKSMRDIQYSFVMLNNFLVSQRVFLKAVSEAILIPLRSYREFFFLIQSHHPVILTRTNERYAFISNVESKAGRSNTQCAEKQVKTTHLTALEIRKQGDYRYNPEHGKGRDGGWVTLCLWWRSIASPQQEGTFSSAYLTLPLQSLDRIAMFMNPGFLPRAPNYLQGRAWRSV